MHPKLNGNGLHRDEKVSFDIRARFAWPDTYIFKARDKPEVLAKNSNCIECIREARRHIKWTEGEIRSIEAKKKDNKLWRTNFPRSGIDRPCVRRILRGGRNKSEILPPIICDGIFVDTLRLSRGNVRRRCRHRALITRNYRPRSALASFVLYVHHPHVAHFAKNDNAPADVRCRPDNRLLSRCISLWFYYACQTIWAI